MAKRKRTNNYLQDTTKKAKDWSTRSPTKHKTGMNPDSSKLPH